MGDTSKEHKVPKKSIDKIPKKKPAPTKLKAPKEELDHFIDLYEIMKKYPLTEEDEIL